jgi:hypothetical protein
MQKEEQFTKTNRLRPSRFAYKTSSFGTSANPILASN